jgi:hypothetical protein
MGVRLFSAFTNAVLASPAAAAETAIATTPPINLALDNAQILLFWYLAITIGTNGTSLKVFIRRGSGTAGNFINQSFLATVVAANLVVLSGHYADSPGVVAGQQYTLTATVGAASAASAVADVALTAMVL